MYKMILKPLLFKCDPERIHNLFMMIGSLLGNYSIGRKITSLVYGYENKKLERNYLGINFKNPIGLSAGFDYDGKLVKILPSVGFGYTTVGTVTNKSYEGNKPPRLLRLPKSKSLLVNKGFKSQGVEIVSTRLKDPYLKDITFGVSVGSSNLPEINNIELAIKDYLECFKKLQEISNIKYYELNISCPNTSMTESFSDIKNFSKLLDKVLLLKLNKPIFIKMPNEGNLDNIDQIVDYAINKGVVGFIFSNLAKSRENKYLNSEELDKIKSNKGNFSGRPTEENSNLLIKRYRQRYGKKIVIIGVGGIFDEKTLNAKFEAGADLVQLITGMIYEGPGLIKTLNYSLTK